jgi:SAM-dependent methyltransferase
VSSFKNLEQAGWTEKASDYDKLFSRISDQAIGPLLDAIGDIGQRTLLDVACGTGALAAAAVSRGACVTGIDFAPTMIEIARSKVAGVEFWVGDAEALDLPARTFDAAICSFGLWHMAEPDKALAEFARVLKVGGAFAYTTWLPPEQGWDMLDIVVKAVQAHGKMAVDLPPAPPPFRFADEAEAERALMANGFGTPSFRKETALWRGSTGADLLDLIYRALVRAPMLIDAQTPGAREAIKRQIVASAEAMRYGGRITMRWPYLVVSARLEH